MELKELEALLDAKLDPIKSTILKLEESNEKLVEILTIQARQDESIKHLREDVITCTKDRDELFNRMRAHEQDGGDKVWDTLKMVLTGVGAFFAAILAGKIKL